MFNKIREAQESEKGFTLVELLVVIIIIGILAAVAIPAFLNQRQRANDSAVQADVKNVSTQIETALVERPNATSITGEGSGTVTITVVGASGTTTTDPINLTSGVTVKAAGAANGYTVHGYHSNGKQFRGETSFLKFDSVAGGVQSGAKTTGW